MLIWSCLLLVCRRFRHGTIHSSQVQNCVNSIQYGIIVYIDSLVMLNLAVLCEIVKMSKKKFHNVQFCTQLHNYAHLSQQLVYIYIYIYINTFLQHTYCTVHSTHTSSCFQVEGPTIFHFPSSCKPCNSHYCHYNYCEDNQS